MTVTMALIARRLQLSEATVSRVLSGKGKGFISDGTRRRVFGLANELGYVHVKLDSDGNVTVMHDPVRKGVIAMWVRNPYAPYYARIVRHLQSIASAEGSDLVISGFLDDGHESEFARNTQHIRRPTAWRVDGIIAVDCVHRVQAYLSKARRRAVPVVVAGSEALGGVDSVSFDPVAGVVAATQHLIRQGRARIAHLTGNCSIPSIREARSGTYAKTIADAGLEPLVLSAADESRAAARKCITDAIAAGVRFDALFCLNDDLAIGAYRGLLDAGRRIPADVAIVGYDSIDDTEYLEVPITSVAQDHRLLVKHSWEVLWQRIGGNSGAPASITLAPELVVRSSCGARQGNSPIGTGSKARIRRATRVSGCRSPVNSLPVRRLNGGSHSPT